MGISLFPPPPLPSSFLCPCTHSQALSSKQSLDTRLPSLMSLAAWLNLIVLSLPASTGAADTLATVDEEHPTNRFNDAKCDRLGRLWGGTMGYEDKPGVFSPHMGSLYSYDGGTV